ncbi:MBL fold metallo-hydrolase [Streptomyces kutzneri]|uniref:MBL fold metallo-hydrolase n=1 Tax=Streptomyces kutzneri TaxID=3051179 RepID=UPI0028D57005|nr:MBL fold metallo-hydrolase [Streptomyces sp. DSM 40907]
MTALGDLIEIDDRTVLVLGQELDLAHDQPDVANALVHRAGDTLVLVDTGVTPAFRTALRAAADRVGPWTRALLLTTHGHPDHVGNNDLPDELGVPVEHYVPAPDLDQMRDPESYWVRSFERIAWAAPLPAPELADKVLSLFAPMRPFSPRRPGPTRSGRRNGSGSARCGSPAGPSPTERSGCCAARATAPGT